jgi:predicted dehydrogenase
VQKLKKNLYILRDSAERGELMGKLKIGVVGCGYWGPNIIRNFLQNSSVEKIVCCDLQKERLDKVKSIFSGIETTSDFSKLIKSDIDAIAIVTQIASHHKLAKEALENGKDVLVEKPMTKTSAEALELIKIAEENSRILMVDHTFEYTAPVRKIKEIIDRKELGDIYDISMTRVNLGLFQKDANVIWDLTPHDISILRMLLNQSPTSVRAIAEAHLAPGIEDTAHLTLTFPNKLTAHIYASWLSPRKIREITIIGSKKMLVYDDISPSEKIKIFDKGVDLESKGALAQKYYESFGEINFLYRSGDIHIPKIDEKEPLKEMCDHFIDCVKNRKKPLSDGQSGYNVVRTIEAAQESLKKNGEEIFLNTSL